MAAYRRRVVCEVFIIYIFASILLCDALNNIEWKPETLKRQKRSPPRYKDVDNSFNGNNNNRKGHAAPPDGKDISNNKFQFKSGLPQAKYIPDTGPVNGNLKFNSKLNNNMNNFDRSRIKDNKKQGVHQMKISTTTECAEDVMKFCHGSTNNFAVLDCLQNDLKMEDDVSEKCQHFLYLYKSNLTKDDRFDMASKEVCAYDLNQIEECRLIKDGTDGPGFVIPCLVENIENVTDKNCQQYLAKMSTIVFSDYRRVYKFIENCDADIKSFKCGRIGTNPDDELLHNQGATIDCLAQKMAKKKNVLNLKCKKQVLRILELQSDDYHLDRPLYYACRDDRELLCEHTRAGGGKIYECLYRHIASKEISEKCRSRLEFRQRLIAGDIKIDKTFYVACRKDIKKYDCLDKMTGSPEIKRATVLRCLESIIKEDKRVSSNCVHEMKEVRKSIMEDFNVNPDIFIECHTDIEQHCSDTGVGGETMHCLMALANPRHNKALISPQCKRALEEVLQEADVGSDYSIDTALLKACQSVIYKVCSQFNENDGSTMNCLMDNLDHEDMTTRCEKVLLEIQYFIVRDFRLDNQLYRSCKKDAKIYCNAESNWYDNKNPHPENDPNILPCLYRQMKEHPKSPGKQLSRECRHEIHRVMKQRAKSVDLEPEIEQKCIHDLSKFCSENSDLEPGEEIICLQDNYEDLQLECKDVIGNFTEDEDEDYEMDTRIMKACTPMIKRFCSDLLDSDAEPSDILECLIEHKNNHYMSSKCQAGIEHHQIISLKDFQFNHKFKEACQSEVVKYCPKKKTKYDVVSCLSEHVRNDTLLENDHRIAKKCRKQLKFEVLQREENIILDPKLNSSCSVDISNLCKAERGNGVVLECLKRNQKDLSTACHKMIFKRQKDEFAIADYGIATACKKMIHKYCKEEDNEESRILECLKRAKDQPSFDLNCLTVVLRRQIAQSHDYRLNPQLSKLCRDDIPKFCKDILSDQKNDEELEGKVINCLKQKYRIKRLSRECSYEIEGRIKDAAVDIRLAPQLSLICKTEIKKHCSDELLSPGIKGFNIADTLGTGQLLECLKDKFMKRLITDKDCRQEIAFLIEENQIDVNVDPHLSAACQIDIQRICVGIKAGEGKIMSCLLSTLEDSPKHLAPKCHAVLLKRKQMWEYAAQVAPPESFQDVYDSITQSPAKAYFLGVLASVVAIIFIIGISCGRVSKRVRAEQKNR